MKELLDRRRAHLVSQVTNFCYYPPGHAGKSRLQFLMTPAISSGYLAFIQEGSSGDRGLLPGRAPPPTPADVVQRSDQVDAAAAGGSALHAGGGGGGGGGGGDESVLEELLFGGGSS